MIGHDIHYGCFYICIYMGNFYMGNKETLSLAEKIRFVCPESAHLACATQDATKFL